MRVLGGLFKMLLCGSCAKFAACLVILFRLAATRTKALTQTLVCYV